MTDRLDAALADLAAAVDFPPTPDLRAGVADRLAEPPRRRWLAPAATGRWSWRSSRLLVLAAACRGLVLALPGLRLTLVPTLPTASVAGRPARRPGWRSAPPLPSRRSRTSRPARSAPPDEAYVIGDGEVISLVYAAGDELPELDGTGHRPAGPGLRRARSIASRSRSWSSRSGPA